MEVNLNQISDYKIVKLWVYYPHIDYTWAVFDKGGKEVFRSMFIPECEKFINQKS